MMMIMSVTTAMGAKTAAIIQRLLGGFLTTAEKKTSTFHHHLAITQHLVDSKHKMTTVRLLISSLEV